MVTKKRVISLDIFRGITVAAMIFVNTLPISPYTPELLKHSIWIGLTFVDLVFPFFLFIVGVSMAYSFAHRSWQSKWQLWGHLFYRVAALYAIGLFLNWLGGGLPLRIPGVLQLIALASLFAAPMARSKPKLIIPVAALLLIIQSSILLFAGAPGITAGTFQYEQNIAGWVDVQVFGAQHLFEENIPPDFDPEGILSIITATAMVLLGLTFGRTLQGRRGNWKTMKILLAGGVIAIILGILISPWLPIIKQLWTASFVLITAGIAIIILTLLYTYIDLLQRKSILMLAVPLGLNALVLYVFSAFLNTLTEKIFLTSTTEASISVYELLYHFSENVLGPNGGAIIYAAIIVIFWGLIALIMHRKKIYIKL